ncbi:MAG: exo-alpha-sialidase [Planctomycetes bacterium]|nr:exo-alpha-sialidase [Planctomycetota bacterium]
MDLRRRASIARSLFPRRCSAALIALLFAAPASFAQGGGKPEGEPLGPTIGPRDATYLQRLRQHVAQKPQPAPPSPPAGPDQQPDAGRGGAQCECSIAIDPNDELHVVGAAIDFASGSALTTWYTSFDGGQSWTSGVFPNVSGFALNGDCTVVITPNGIPVITLLQYFGPGGSGVYSYRSLDGGLTWQAPLLVDLDGANDKVQSAVDLSNGPHRGQVAIAWDRFFTGTGDNVWVAVSDDDAASWRSVQRVDDSNGSNAISPDVAYGPNSELWVMWADRGSFDIMLDRSLDGGATWGSDLFAGDYVQVPSTLPNNFFRLFDIFSLAVDQTQGPWSGSIYVAYHRWGGTPKHADIYVVHSHDGGATWVKNNVNVGDTTRAHQVMPWAAVDSHGNLNIAFWDSRLDPNNYLQWLWVARSSNGGTKWREFPVSDAGFDFAATDGWYLGDYIGLDVSDHYVRPFWPDGTSGSLDQASDELHLDLHTDLDVLSAATGGVVNFDLNVGPNQRNASYWLLGSFSTSPGLDFGPVHLPLNYDPLFETTLYFANSALLANSLGVLDSTGSAKVVLDTQGPFDPALAGVDTYWAAYVFGPRPIYATNPTVISLVP